MGDQTEWNQDEGRKMSMSIKFGETNIHFWMIKDVHFPVVFNWDAYQTV